MPAVSIVLPAFNEARRLPATLRGWRSFLSQQSYSAEVLVVDDGSSDDTARIAQGAADQVVRLGQNQGKGFAVRAGVLQAAGDVIGYADADIIPLLRNINTAFDPQKIHEPTDSEYKEFDTGRRHPWAEDRVM